MAESETETVGKNLIDIFCEGWKLLEEFDSTPLKFNSLEFQNKVKKCIELFEDCTRIVSLVGMFTINETIGEVATEHVQYLLLPFFLGQLTDKLHQSDRLQILDKSEFYYRDFLKRCEDYEIIKEVTTPPTPTDQQKIDDEKSGISNLISQANKRKIKIAEFNHRKQLEESIINMKIKIMDPNVDDEIKRDFFIKYIERSCIDARSELENIKLEKGIVALRKEKNERPERFSDEAKTSKFKKLQNESAIPIILTRDAAQKAVYGLGYPSMPVFTVREFYDQRVKDGIFPNQKQVAEMNQRMSTMQNDGPDDEEDAIRSEILIEEDDPENLARLRAKDEYKDQVRRGDGNRYNRS